MAVHAATPGPDRDWQAEDDHRTLMRSAEIMADKVRIAGVIRVKDRQKKAEAKLAGMLAMHKTNGKLRKAYGR